jgi:hypothetical protein
MDGWMDGWTDGWTDGRMDGYMDGRMDTEAPNATAACHKLPLPASIFGANHLTGTACGSGTRYTSGSVAVLQCNSQVFRPAT